MRSSAGCSRHEALTPVPWTSTRAQTRPPVSQMVDDLFDPKTFGSAQEVIEFVGNVLESSTEYSIVATDPTGLIMLWNEGAHRLYGYAPGEVIGRSWSMLHTEQDVSRGLPEEMMAGALRDGRWQGTVVRVRKDGSHFTARVVTTPRRRAGGEQTGFLLMSSDMSEQVRLNRELDYARSLLELAPDAMVIVNADGKIQLANAATERLFGYTREALIGAPVEVLIPDRYQTRHPEHRDGFFSSPRARSMGQGLDLSGRRQDGSEFPVEISLSPLDTEEGPLATAAIRDVSERKRAERDLSEANVQLENASRAKDRFLASMSHELRTPLNAILGFTGTLLMELPGPLNEEQTKQLRTVQRSSRHLLSLINDLLDLARIESGKLELHDESIDCRDLLEEVVVGLRPLADEKALALELVHDLDRLELCSDRRALSQILINLANNAIKFTDEGSVRLGLSRRRDDVGLVTRFSVTDTGRGIRVEDQERLFAAFEQIGGPDARPYEGTGLGLYICQTLAPLIGGAITFESEVDAGSTFALEITQRATP
jgi:PAS domain S-box-containing protein